ncbi:MAG: tRNA (adenosine(37)-N6)-threonylcarbamoyltransferase complex dimerization subunit type 1 TsaB [Candidatus Hydrogenedentes bacterium]|nr:tRNA (adenosine(37)-N6)-threonylcarbamoyltransferase complex dimerization subunit type 1 TsaB [Candidatus Hydrogenedentota bacterium]
MKLLAVDTSTSSLSIAICRQDSVLVEATLECDRRHTERLLATVDWALKEVSLTLADLGALAVTIGPGSFTGLRVGLAAMKGLAVGARLPLIGVLTLDAMARMVGISSGTVCPLLDAKMGEVFGAAYAIQSLSPVKLSPDRVCSVQAFLENAPAEAYYLGDGALLYRSEIARMRPESHILGPLFGAPRASAVAQEARHILESGAVATNPDEVVPVYLRVSQAEQARDRAVVS